MGEAAQRRSGSTKSVCASIRRCCCCSSVGCVAAVLVTAQGRFDANGHPLGTDFSQVWVAGLETLRGHPEAPFDLERHIAAQRAEFGADSDVYGWHYPPFFLAPAAALAHLPYLEALAVWQIGDARALSRRRARDHARKRGSRPGAIALIGARLSGGARQSRPWAERLSDRRPARLRLSALRAPTRCSRASASRLLAYKPQFALALPVALHRRRPLARDRSRPRRRSLVMTLASVAAFGPESWIAFCPQPRRHARDLVVEHGAAGFPKIQSVFAAVRLLGADIATAYAAQTLRHDGDRLRRPRLAVAQRAPIIAPKPPATIVATFLTTPYCLDYDMTALAPAFALLVAQGLERGFGPYMKSALAAAFVIPLVGAAHRQRRCRCRWARSRSRRCSR